MLRQGFQLFALISISQILLQAPVKYATAFLDVETDDNDLTYFIVHQTDVIQKAVEALHDYVEHRQAALRAAEERLRGMDGLNHRQQALIGHSLREPDSQYTIEGHRRSHGVVYQTARTDLLDLAERGLLQMQKNKRALVFRPSKDLSGKLDQMAAARDHR
jgi:Fic family protein